METPPPMGGVVGWVDGMGSGQITKNQINLDLIEIFQFCLKIQHLWRLPHLWVGGWVAWWVGSGQITKNWINLDLIEIFQFYWRFNICGDSPTHGWVYGWLGGLMGGSGQITQNQINLDSIKIFQFSLKIYNLWRHPNLWADVWMHGWVWVNG